MRNREEILSNFIQNINKAPEETRPMIWHEYYFIEVLIDIRDMLNERLLELDRGLHYLHDKIK